MTDRETYWTLLGFVMLCALAALLAGCSLHAGCIAAARADEQPDPVPTTSRPVADTDAATPDDAEAHAEDVYDAVTSGRWLVVAGLVLMAIVKLLREAGTAIGGRWRWLATDRGGAVVAMALPILAQVGMLLASGRAPTASGLAGAIAAGAVASGLRVQVSRLLRPRDGARVLV